MRPAEKLENQEPLLPISGRDEMNLVEIPFTLLTNRVENHIKTIQGPNWIITGSDNFGLPVAIDEEVYVAMMKFTKDYDFQRREIPFSRYQMVNLMGWDRTGKSYNRIRDALDRLAGVYIRTDAFWDNRLKQNVSQGFHILESYLIVEGKPGRKKSTEQMDLSLSTFTWSDTIFNSFQAGYIKLLDTERYFRLSLPTSKRAYRILDKRLYQRDSIEVELHDYAFNCLGLSRDYRYPSKIKEKLDPSFQELIADGFLEGVSYRETEESILIVIKAAPKKLRTGQNPNGQEQGQESPSLLPARAKQVIVKGKAESDTKGSIHEPQDLIERLRAFGVVANQVTGPEELIRDYGAEEVAKRVALCEHLVKKGKAPLSPQIIVDSLRKGYLPDPYHEIAAEQERQAEREAREQALVEEWKRRQEEARAQVEEWFSLLPEKRINFGRLDFWETQFRLKHLRNPTEKEKAERVSRMIAELPGREERLAQLLREIRSELDAKAREQGIRFQGGDL